MLNYSPPRVSRDQQFHIKNRMGAQRSKNKFSVLLREHQAWELGVDGGNTFCRPQGGWAGQPMGSCRQTCITHLRAKKMLPLLSHHICIPLGLTILSQALDGPCVAGSHGWHTNVPRQKLPVIPKVKVDTEAHPIHLCSQHTACHRKVLHTYWVTSISLS